MTISTLTLMCDVIKNQLALGNDQIWIYNQKINIPTDGRLYVIVSQVSAQQYAAGKKHTFSVTMTSTTHQHAQETIRIDLLSAGSSAIDRAQEVIGALSSDYAEELANANGLRFPRLPSSFVDTSATEVTQQLYRTTIELKVLRAYTQSKTATHYDSFTRSIRTERGIV